MSVYVVDGEYRTSNGRIDILIKTDKYIYVMEFKYDGSAQEVIDQIDTTYRYGLVFSPQRVFRISHLKSLSGDLIISAALRSISPYLKSVIV